MILLICAALAAPAAAQTFPALTGHVVDQANIIPDEREAAMSRLLGNLQRVTGRQLVVATLPGLEGRTIEDVGYRLGRRWGIGQRDASDGVILLVAPNERRVRIEVGYGLESLVTDAFSSRTINEEILPRFNRGEVVEGIEAGVNALVVQLAALPEEAGPPEAAPVAGSADGERSLLGSILFPFQLALAMLIMFGPLILLGWFVWSRFREPRRAAPAPTQASALSSSGRRRGPHVTAWGPADKPSRRDEVLAVLFVIGLLALCIALVLLLQLIEAWTGLVSFLLVMVVLLTGGAAGLFRLFRLTGGGFSGGSGSSVAGGGGSFGGGGASGRW